MLYQIVLKIGSPKILQNFTLAKSHGTNHSLFKKCILISYPDVITNFTGWCSGKDVYLYSVRANLCRGPLAQFFVDFLVSPCKFLYSASKSYDLFFPSHSNPSYKNNRSIGFA